jgi:Mg2+ and Co2+ transporter CorA
MDETKLTTSKQASEDTDLKNDHKQELLEKVNLLLPDGLMIVLAVIMIPVVLIPLLVDLPKSLSSSFVLADYTILGIFVIRFILKAALAKNFRKYILNPWHILDLIIVILPLIDFLQLFATGIGRYSPLLRLLRISRVVAVGGRALDMKMQQKPAAVKETFEQPVMGIEIMDDNLDNLQRGSSLRDVVKYLNNASNTWVDFSSVSELNIDELSQILGIPRLVLENELIEESYPRIDYFEHYSMMFARLGDLEIPDKKPRRLLVHRAGLLVICSGNNIITISKGKEGLFSLILKEVKKYHSKEEPLAVTILYSILKYALEKDYQIITALEQEVIKLESIPLAQRPADFLETTFNLKKEVNQMVPALLHMKEIASLITSKRVPLEGFSDRHGRLFDMLADQATYLQETAANARDNLLSLIDLYINTTSFELNKVMRIVAVITCLGVIPTLAGLFGSNLVGNPWDIELWQLFAGLAIAMIGLGWVFYRLGWLKG